MRTEPVPFSLQIPQAQIDDLRERLARTRWPDQAPGAPWAVGTDLAAMRALAETWRTNFDWRAQEALLNAFPQIMLEQDDIRLHALHVPGQGPDPMPLLLMHGWPGSVFEFIDIIPRLTDPARFGGDPADAFTVVAPSLPGYGLSFRPGQARLGLAQMADRLAGLMTDTLGYARFAVQGGDWGAHLCANLGARHADKLVGIHVNMLSIPLDAPPPADPSPDERRYLEEVRQWVAEENGYGSIQGTRPQTLAYAMTDSPVGLAAWIVEKFRAWSDRGAADGPIEDAIDRDRMLANISLYWVTEAIGSSFWPYYARMHGDLPIPAGRTVDVPAGYAEFPREIRHPPRSMAQQHYTDIRRWTVMPKGGHFAALEQPAALAGEVAAFYQALRA